MKRGIEKSQSTLSTRESKKEDIDEAMDIDSPEDAGTVKKLLPSGLHDPFKAIILQRYLSPQDIVNFGKASRQTYAWTEKERVKIRKKAADELLCAVVQGDEAKARDLLENNPGLLYCTEGEARDYSKRSIKKLTSFQAALCAGDVEMCEMMKAYFARFQDGQAAMEKQFNAVFSDGIDTYVKMQQDNVFNFSEILQAIINAPANEVTEALAKRFNNDFLLHQALENFKAAFTEKSLSEIVFNPYHLLRAFQTYNTKFKNLGNGAKRDLFWRQVVGFVQRYLSACYLQASAQGAYYIVEKKQPLRRSFNFQWSDCDFQWSDDSIVPFQDVSGLGFDFGAVAGSPRQELARYGSAEPGALEIMCRAKTSRLEKLLSPIQHKRELGV